MVEKKKVRFVFLGYFYLYFLRGVAGVFLLFFFKVKVELYKRTYVFKRLVALALS